MTWHPPLLREVGDALVLSFLPLPRCTFEAIATVPLSWFARTVSFPIHVLQARGTGYDVIHLPKTVPRISHSMPSLPVLIFGFWQLVECVSQAKAGRQKEGRGQFSCTSKGTFGRSLRFNLRYEADSRPNPSGHISEVGRSTDGPRSCFAQPFVIAWKL